MKRLICVIVIIIAMLDQSDAFVPSGCLWPESKIPLDYSIQPSVSASDNATIRSAMDVWTFIETTFFEFNYDGTSNAVLGQNDGINNIGFGTSLQWSGTLAVTFWWFNPSTDVTLDADIEFNSTVNWGGNFDLMTVAIHEAGHVLGLGHETQKDSVMQPIYDGVVQELYEDDIDGISSLYPGKKYFIKDHIYQNAPNPFVPDTPDDYTVIGYSVADDGHVRLELYNLAGELVKVLVDEYKEKGDHIGSRGARWYGDNGSLGVRGSDVSSGVYVAVLKTPRTKVKTRKIMIVR